MKKSMSYMISTLLTVTIYASKADAQQEIFVPQNGDTAYMVVFNLDGNILTAHPLQKYNSSDKCWNDLDRRAMPRIRKMVESKRSDRSWFLNDYSFIERATNKYGTEKWQVAFIVCGPDKKSMNSYSKILKETGINLERAVDVASSQVTARGFKTD